MALKTEVTISHTQVAGPRMSFTSNYLIFSSSIASKKKETIKDQSEEGFEDSQMNFFLETRQSTHEKKCAQTGIIFSSGRMGVLTDLDGVLFFLELLSPIKKLKNTQIK